MKFFDIFCRILLISLLLILSSCASPGDEKSEKAQTENKIEFWIQMMGTLEGRALIEYQHRLIMEGDKAYPQLLKGLKHLSPEVRGSCAYILGQIGNKNAIEHLIPLLEDPVDRVRFDAAASLVELQENIGLYYMILALDHKNPYYRYQASEVLKKYTGLSFNFEADGHPYDRRDSRNQWIRWWNKNKDTYQIKKERPTKKPKLEEIPFK